MKNHILILLFSGIWIAGCSNVRLHQEETNAGKQEMIAHSMQGSLDITLKDGRQYKGSEFSVEADTLNWKDSESGENYSAAINDIEKVTRISRGRGALFGTLAGASIGCAYGVRTAQKHWETSLGAIYFCPVLAVAGALPGAGIGAIVGYRTNYTWEPSKTDD